MKTLARQMAIYNAYHRNAKNKATHFVGVPLIVFALMIPLSWPSFPIGGGGWILQLIGHIFEGRRPALVDNFFQIFVAPVFLVAEIVFALGARLELKREVESLTAR